MSSKKTAEEQEIRNRVDAVDAAIRQVAEARGHKIDQKDCSMVISGERVGWRTYEPSIRRKIPLTPKELADPFCYSWNRERGWRYELQPSKSLAIVVDAEYHAEIRIADTRKRLLEAAPDRILDKFEAIAAEAIARRESYEENARLFEERRQRREARIRLEQIEQQKRDELEGLAKDWIEAQNLQRFVDAAERLERETPDPSGRVREWLSWARGSIEANDPLAGGTEGLVALLFPRELSEYEEQFGEPDDIDD